MIGIARLTEALEAEREARRQVERELDRLRGTPTDDEAATRRSRFLVSMGHTLRTPLNAILGFSEVLQQEECGLLTDRQRTFVKRIVEAGQRQLGLINNLIDLTRIHAGETVLEPEAVDVAPLVRSVLAEYASAAGARRVELSGHADDSGMVRCDPELIRQALANLVGNAIRFTEAGGTVRVTATKQVGSSEVPAMEDEADEVVCLEVADTGPGIPPEEQPFLFDDFEHAESLTARRERRSGVGLALARRIVELHGGRIWVESTGVKGEGSRFFIEVPAYAEVRCSV